jgi:DNA-binding CsgD family transcriptional regulator
MLTALAGRDDVLARLVDPRPAASAVQVVLGDAGMGKTAVLTELVARAGAAGTRVLTVTGREFERDLAFAGLHQLLTPVLDRLPALPDRQAKALLGAFALTADPVPPDALLTSIAVLTLLSALAEDGPVLVVVDDAQWLDRASLDALAFAARRLDTEPLALLIAARGRIAPPGFAGFDELVLPPLAPADAGRLLDALPQPPRGRARDQVLAQAAGNPLALVELSTVVAADPDAGRRWAAEPLPLTERLTAVLAERYGVLPEPSRAALLLAAVADRPEVAARVPGLDAAALAPAERAGLIRIDPAGPQFTHPLVRAAVHHAVPFAERAAAHRQVAEAVRDQPDRYAWHLAAATVTPDERVAAALEESAAQARRRGGSAAAARVLERAAALSPAESDQARRLLTAAGLAQVAGQADWVSELAGRVLALTADEALRRAARQHIGWALVWSGDHAAALTMLLAVAAEAPPAQAGTALAFAATVAFRTGAPADQAAVLATLAAMPGPVDAEQQLYVRACAAPLAARTGIVADLRRIAAGPVSDPTLVGSAAWMVDETDLAVRLLREALTRLRAPGLRGRSGGALTALQWACVDAGRWDEALAVAREAQDAAAAYGMPPVAAGAGLCVVAVHAFRGEPVRPAPVGLPDPETTDYRSAAARSRLSAGATAFARGDFAAAYGQLRRLFSGDGEPLHPRVSYLGLADLAAAAVRIDAAGPDERVLAAAEASGGPRIRQLVSRARGLMATSADAGRHYEAALADPAGDQWPFERALVRLDHGEWLRRRRRINDAKPVLTDALETFRRLRATPWAGRAEAELRACGIPGRPAVPDALAGLTAQQREIVILAGRGLTNAEIADRLFLSPRTVASHLYRSYPKLGVAGRHQLRDLK